MTDANDLQISRNYKLFKRRYEASQVMNLQISRNYKLFKPDTAIKELGYLQISRNYKLFKLLHCHYSQF